MRGYKQDIFKERKFGHMVAHKRTHTGDKPYECDVCNKRFPKLSNLACTKRRNVETKRPKRNGRNDRNETTETKRPKRNDRNETTETKRPKRNDRNEMTETKRPKRNSRKYKLQEKWKTLKLIMKFTGNFIEILRQLGCGSTGL